MKARSLSIALAVATLAPAIAGCGGGGGSSSADLAGFAPPGAALYIQGEVRPTGSLKVNVDSIAKRVAGIDNLGDFLVSKLEKSARESGEPVDFAKEIEPWLGQRAAIFFTVEGVDNEEADFVIESTDPQATQAFVDAQAKSSRHPYQDASYKGVAFKVGGKDDNAVGVVDGSLVQADTERQFQQIVDASSGESLADQERFKTAFSATKEGSLADAYVDIGGLIKRSKTEITQNNVSIFKSLGIDLTDATAVASLVPGSDQVEIDLSSDLFKGGSANADTTELLGSLPSGAFAALAVSDLGKQLEETIDRFDAAGIPPNVPPHRLKEALKAKGIDLEQIASSVEDAAVFGVGSDRAGLGGALVMTTENATRATNTVANIGLMLRTFGVPGVAALSGPASGFSIRSPGLGSKPLVIAAEGDNITIGYGLPATLSHASQTLSDSADYRAAVASLGDTPISGFVDGSAALELAEALASPSETGFQKAKRYLQNIRFIAMGSGSEGDRATAKLIVGLTK
jgi:hypothetical protein